MDMQDIPDTDPQETQEWLEALDGVLKHEGAQRAATYDERAQHERERQQSDDERDHADGA